MFKAAFIGLLAIPLPATASAPQAAKQDASTRSREPRPHHIEKEWVRKEQGKTPPGYFCHSTKPSYPNGYPHLPVVPRTDGLKQFGGPLLTWTPNDNVQECHVRQLYFWVDTAYVNAANGAGPDISIYMTRHGEVKAISQPLVWDIVSIQYPGATLYRVDAEQVKDPASAKGLHGNFDFVVNVVGTPAS